MKNFIRFILVFFGIVFVVSCQYDDKFIIDEHDGHSTLMFFDEVAQMKVYYLDENDNLKYDSGELILYRESKEGFRFVKNGTCYDIIQVVGVKETVIGSVCNGQNGADGKPGENASDLLIQSIPYTDPSGKTGQLFAFYLDKNGNGIIDAGDIYRYTSLPVLNGSDGAAGKIPMPSMNIVGDSLIYTFSVDGVVIYRKAVPKSKDGINGSNGIGISPSLKTTETCFGVIYLWYLDLNHNKVYDSAIDIKLSENLIKNGEDGNPASALVCLTEEYDFQTGCATYITNTGFKMDGFILSVADGALYLEKSCGSVTLPPFSQNMNLLSLRFNYGSVNPYDITVKAVYFDNSEETIKTVHLNSNPNFNRATYTTYSQFEYYTDLDNVHFKNIKAIKIYGALSAKCVPQNLFIDQVIICLWDRNVH